MGRCATREDGDVTDDGGRDMREHRVMQGCGGFQVMGKWEGVWEMG